jgi:hypothetical protein
MSMRKSYRLKGSSPYFLEKYGTSNPIVEVQGTDVAVLKVCWQDNTATIAILYARRVIQERLPQTGTVYYVKVEGRAGELVHESELGEELDDEGAELLRPGPTPVPEFSGSSMRPFLIGGIEFWRIV